MAFIGKFIRGIGQAIGLIPETPSVPQLPPAPTAADKSAQMDAAAQEAAAGVQRGRTSTLLTGGQGDTQDQKYTSKVLLGQ